MMLADAEIAAEPTALRFAWKRLLAGSRRVWKATLLVSAAVSCVVGLAFYFTGAPRPEASILVRHACTLAWLFPFWLMNTGITRRITGDGALFLSRQEELTLRSIEIGVLPFVTLVSAGTLTAAGLALTAVWGSPSELHALTSQVPGIVALPVAVAATLALIGLGYAAAPIPRPQIDAESKGGDAKTRLAPGRALLIFACLLLPSPVDQQTNPQYALSFGGLLLGAFVPYIVAFLPGERSG